MLGSVVHFVNFCIWREAAVQVHSFECGCPVVPTSFIKKTVLCSLNCLGILVENQLSLSARFLHLAS